jgi:hypothetical protein
MDQQVVWNSPGGWGCWLEEKRWDMDGGARGRIQGFRGEGKAGEVFWFSVLSFQGAAGELGAVRAGTADFAEVADERQADGF